MKYHCLLFAWLLTFSLSFAQEETAESQETFSYERVEAVKAEFGPNSDTLASEMTFLAGHLLSFSRFDEIRRLLQQASQIMDAHHPADHPLYRLIYHHSMSLYKGLAKTDSAMIYANKSIPLSKKIWGAQHPNYAMDLMAKGSIFQMNGQFDSTISYFKKAEGIVLKARGKEHADYYFILNQLGYLNEYIGNYSASLRYYKAALDIVRINPGPDHAEYGIALAGVAAGYSRMSFYEKAIPYVQEALEVFERTVGKTHGNYGTLQNNLASYYRAMGDYEKALPIFLKLIEGRDNAPENVAMSYVAALHNTGMCYSDMGQYEKAVPYVAEGFELIEQHGGRKHAWYGIFQQGLAGLYYYKGDYESALAMSQDALDHSKEYYGEGHFNQGASYNILANIYEVKGDYERAKSYVQLALDNTLNNAGSEHERYATYLEHQGNLFYEMDQNPAAALNNYQQASLIVRTNMGQNHIKFASNMSRQALFYEALGNTDSAAVALMRVDQALQHQFQHRFTALNDRLQNSFLHTLKPFLNQFNSFLLDHPQYNELAELAYNQQLELKGLLMGSRTALLQSLRDHPDSALTSRFEEWNKLHRLLGREYQKSFDKRTASFDSLRNLAEELEIYLADASSDFRQAKEKVNWQAVQAQLKEGEIAIEFAQFPYYQQGKTTDQSHYVAFLLKSGEANPLIVPLFEAQKLESLLNSKNATESIGRLYASRGLSPRKNIHHQQSLTELIWRPLEAHLSDIQTIYYAPSGLLHRINLAALPIDQNRLLSDKYSLIQLGSTRNLVFSSDHSAQTKFQNALLMGGIDYDPFLEPDIPLVEQTDWPDPDLVSLDEMAIASRGHTDSWQFLQGTAIEVNNISKLLQEKGFDVQQWQGPKASEEALKSLDTAPAILHIATHGYFFPDPQDSLNLDILSKDQKIPVRMSEHPMVRSGLILAGANHAWSGASVSEGEDDGILTAYEISRLDLSNTELVVLSACETGLGDIQGNEGVYGLQRAFKIAGARYILMSLWQVPDQETQELMTLFYSEWLNGKDIRQAFYTAQNQMRKKYKDPYLWAGFVLVE